jgi:hypothetical protein
VPRQLADRLRELRAEGSTLAQIAERLNDEAVPTAQGGSRWWPATVRSAIRTRERELAAQ